MKELEIYEHELDRFHSEWLKNPISCKKCYSELWYIDGVKYCVSCDWNKISRGLKIKKIKKLI